MKNIKNLERLQQLHVLIENAHTGSPKEVSQKLGISERLVYMLLDQLKSLDAKICYNRNTRSYYYCEPFQLHISISVSVVNANETTELYAGSYFEKHPLQMPKNQGKNRLLAS